MKIRKIALCMAVIIAILTSAGVVVKLMAAPESETETDSNGTVNILLCGIDSAAENTDVMMILSCDFSDERASVLQIPRDTMVNTGNGVCKINHLYPSYLSLTKDKKRAAEMLCKFTEDNFGIKTDRYVIITTDALAKIVDRIGGVEIDVPEDMYYKDEEQNLEIDIRAGKHTLNGDEAVKFVRYRKGYATGDLGRIDAQKVFLSALLNRLKTLGTVRAAAAAMSVIGEVTTDIGVSDIGVYTGAMRIPGDRINAVTMPGEAVRYDGDSGQWYYVLNKKACAELINSEIGEDKRNVFDKNEAFNDKTRMHISNIYGDKNFKYKKYTLSDKSESEKT